MCFKEYEDIMLESHGGKLLCRSCHTKAHKGKQPMTNHTQTLFGTMLLGIIGIVIVWLTSGFWTAFGVFVMLFANNQHEAYRDRRR